MTDFVWVARLLASRYDSVVGQSASLEDGGVDNGAQFFGRQGIVAINQTAIPAHFRVLESLNAFRESDFRHHERAADSLDLFGGLPGPFRKKCPRPAFHFDSQLAQFLGQAEWEAAGHDYLSDALLPQQELHDSRD